MRKLTTIVLVACTLCFIPNCLRGQVVYGSSNIGLGLGLDYGGIGGRIALAPSPRIGVFAGLGYNLNGLGYNVGASIFLSSDKPNIPYITAMYGYNGVVVVSNRDDLNKTFYGPSIGFGYEFHSRAKGKEHNFWNIELLIPFRESGFNDYLDDLEDNYGVEYKNKPLPFSICVGYHFGL